MVPGVSGRRGPPVPCRVAAGGVADPSCGPAGLAGPLSRRRSVALRAWLLRQAEHPLADDLALDLGGATPDRLGAREEERSLQQADRVARARGARADARHELLAVATAGQDLPLHP